MTKKLRSLDYKILFALTKNSRITDKELAKIVGVSQPTITRRRIRLEKENVLDYTAIPNFKKLGFEILAFHFAHWKHEAYPDERMPKAKSFLSKHPNIIFVSTGRGLRMDRMFISLHKDYADYAKFMRELKGEWWKSMKEVDSFIVSLKSDNILRQLTFKHLEEYIEKNC